MKKLFFIGNGFDMQHKVHYVDEDNNKIYSTLESFSQVLEEKNEKLYKKIDCLLEKNERSWNELENIQFRDHLKINEQNNFDKYLQKWINKLNKNLNMELFKDDKEACEEYEYLKNNVFDDETYFINFNYTDTLEEIYNIDDNKILHLHGNEECPIFAHNASFSPHYFFRDRTKINFNKPVSALKNKLENWLSEKKDCDELENLYVYGFSFSGSDKEYLTDVIFRKCPNIKQIRFSDHQVRDIKCCKEDNPFIGIKPIGQEHISIADFEGNIITDKVHNCVKDKRPCKCPFTV